MSSTVLVCGPIVHAQQELEAQIGPLATILHLDVPDRAAFFQACASGGAYSQITAIYRHNDSASKIGVFDAELIKHLPSTLKAICHNGAGYDQIDVHACKERGILVSHTPAAVDDATATTAMYLLLSTLRQFHRASAQTRQGRWKTGLAPAHDPEGKVLGIVGMGGIGCAMARRAEAFNMRIMYHNRRPNPAASSNWTYVATQEELLRNSNVVSLNLPLNAETAGSFGKAQFEQMKQGAVLVNTARGGVVDQEAMIDALNSGKLAGAGLDVYPDEPNIDERLLAMDNCTLLPHMGTETVETQKKMEVQVLGSVKAALETGKPSFIVKEHQ